MQPNIHSFYDEYIAALEAQVQALQQAAQSRVPAHAPFPRMQQAFSHHPPQQVPAPMCLVPSPTGYNWMQAVPLSAVSGQHTDPTSTYGYSLSQYDNWMGAESMVYDVDTSVQTIVPAAIQFPHEPQLARGDLKKCHNCKGCQTSLWRVIDEETLCNACAVYKKRYGKDRPAKMWGNPLKRRNRGPGRKRSQISSSPGSSDPSLP